MLERTIVVPMLNRETKPQPDLVREETDLSTRVYLCGDSKRFPAVSKQNRYRDPRRVVRIAKLLREVELRSHLQKPAYTLSASSTKVMSGRRAPSASVASNTLLATGPCAIKRSQSKATH